ncbi:MAG: copper homeostasis protein CutC, partial [Chitinophagia bacterium]|nr:copper homeostasis protein CutC [Chitinophagia bacterium]
DNPSEGGTTPSYGFIKTARKNLSIDLYPIIRPRGGDFLYSEIEFEVMKADIEVCKNLGCDGVVIGILNADGTVDKKRSKQLVEIANPMKVTFHRAFDRTNDPFQAMEDIISIGCERILTSGLQTVATDGEELLNKLVKKANDRIIIMPGSGVKSDNIKTLIRNTNATEFHSSARTFVNSKMEFINESMNEQLTSVTTMSKEIKKMIEIFENF